MKMQLKLEHLLGDVTFDGLNIPFECVAVDLISGVPVSLNTGKVEEAVRASSSIPLVFRPVLRDGMELVDGATLRRVPVENAKKRGCKVIIAVDVLGKIRHKETPIKNILELGLRSVDVNDSFHTTEYLKKFKPDLLLEPDLGEMSQYKIDKLSFAYEQGYKIGLENADKIKKIIKRKCK